MLMSRRRRASTRPTFEMQIPSRLQDALTYHSASASHAAMRLRPLQPGKWKPQTAWFVATIAGAAGCSLASRPKSFIRYRRLHTRASNYSRTHTVQSVPWRSLLSAPPHSSCPRRERCRQVIALLPHWDACTSAVARIASVAWWRAGIGIGCKHVAPITCGGSCFRNICKRSSTYDKRWHKRSASPSLDTKAISSAVSAQARSAIAEGRAALTLWVKSWAQPCWTFTILHIHLAMGAPASSKECMR